MTLRKLFLVTLLFGQIVLLAATAGNGLKRADGGAPDPPCGPCAVR